MQYNEDLYNGSSYNLTAYSATLVESIAPVDATVTKSIGILRTDSQASADALGGSASLQAFLETVTFYQRAHTPFAYNNGMYNQFMYNVRADEDEILLMATKALQDSVALNDTLGAFEFAKLLVEALTPTDAAILFATSLVLDEFIFLSEFHRIEITNKALNETLRVADWLSIERNPVNQEWYD